MSAVAVVNLNGPLTGALPIAVETGNDLDAQSLIGIVFM